MKRIFSKGLLGLLAASVGAPVCEVQATSPFGYAAAGLGLLGAIGAARVYSKDAADKALQKKIDEKNQTVKNALEAVAEIKLMYSGQWIIGTKRGIEPYYLPATACQIAIDNLNSQEFKTQLSSLKVSCITLGLQKYYDTLHDCIEPYKTECQQWKDYYEGRLKTIAKTPHCEYALNKAINALNEELKKMQSPAMVRQSPTPMTYVKAVAKWTLIPAAIASAVLGWGAFFMGWGGVASYSPGYVARA